jgi:hypothetical protein
MSEELGGSEVLKIFVIHDDCDGVHGTFGIGGPCAEGIKNCEKFLVMDHEQKVTG